MDHLYYLSNLYKAYITGIMIFENKNIFIILCKPCIIHYSASDRNKYLWSAESTLPPHQIKMFLYCQSGDVVYHLSDYSLCLYQDTIADRIHVEGFNSSEEYPRVFTAEVRENKLMWSPCP